MQPSHVSSEGDQRTTNNTMRHQYRVLTDEEKAQMLAIKDAGLALEELIRGLGHSREISIAITRAEEAVMWAVKGITADHPQRPKPPTDPWRRLLDIFDRIAAAIAAKNSGDTSALEAHVAAIDAHLSQVDTADQDEQTRLSNIEAGLAKVADAVAPSAPADTGTGTGTGDPTA